MTKNDRPHFIAYAAITIDGKIARDVKHLTSWTSPEDKKFLHNHLDKSDVIIVGNNTYKISRKYLAKRNCLVFSRSGKVTKNKNLTYFNPQKINLLKYLVKNKYNRVAVLGGTEIYTYFLDKDLLDDLYLTIEPVSFGVGLPLHKSKRGKRKPRFISVIKLNKKGTLLIHYEYS